MEAHFAGSSSSLTQVARCTGSGAQYISSPSPSLQHHTQAGLGEGNPLAKPLLAALKVARSKVNVPVSVQIEMLEKYLARARKRLAVANEELEKAVEKKNSCTSDVEATELRLARLRASVPTPMRQEPSAVAELQGRIDELVRERDALRSAVPLVGDPATLPASGAEEVWKIFTASALRFGQNWPGNVQGILQR